jgi:N-methylhydantoinase A
MTECRVFARSELSPEHPIKGPALVLQADTTTLVPPGWRSTVDIMGNLDLEAL